MKLAVIFLMISSPAMAQMTPAGCNLMSASASNAAAQLRDTIGQVKGEAFHAAMPSMPESVKDEAADVEDARIGAESAIREYMISLDAFSKAIKDCGG